MELAVVLLSALAIFVSVVVALLQLQMHKQQHDVQQRLAAIEEERREEEVENRAAAKIHAQLEPLDLSRAVVTLTNRGGAAARDLRVAEVRPVTQGRLAARVRNSEDFPIRMLRPGDEASARLDYTRGNCDHSCDLIVAWSDDRGPQTDSFRLRHPRRN